jgi:hypothetical protein
MGSDHSLRVEQTRPWETWMLPTASDFNSNDHNGTGQTSLHSFSQHHQLPFFTTTKSFILDIPIKCFVVFSIFQITCQEGAVSGNRNKVFKETCELTSLKSLGELTMDREIPYFRRGKTRGSKMTPEEPSSAGRKAEPNAQGDEDGIGPIKIDQITDEGRRHRGRLL